MLTVLNVAYPYAAVSCDAIGGAEQILAELDAALVAGRHTSLVLARADSRVRGELWSTEVPEGPITPAVRADVSSRHRATLRRILRERAVDIIHFHGVDCADYLLETQIACVVTLHLPVEQYAPALFDAQRNYRFVCVSQAQRVAWTGSPHGTCTIENGIDLDRWHPGSEPQEGYVACLGRVCPEKGFHVALAAARRIDVPLLLAGQVFPYLEHERYFAEHIAPVLDGRRRFVGPVQGEGKRRFLAGAACVVVPSTIAETCSLVTMEALACGTPVIVSAVGAPPTLIEPGRTGLVAGAESEIARAIQAARGLDRSRCRASAEQRFGVRRMTARYLELYGAIVRARGGPQRVRTAHRTAAGSFRTELLTRPDELAARETQLWDLYSRAPAATPFQSPAWLCSWAACFVPPGRLRAITVSSGERLVGVLPLWIVKEGSGPVAKLLGVGMSDYLDGLLDPNALGAREALQRALAEVVNDVDGCELNDLREDSTLLTSGLNAVERARREPGAICPRLAVRGTFSEYLQKLPVWVARNLRQSQSRLERAGHVRWQHAAENSLPELLEAFFELHAARWRSKGQAGALADPAVHEFHRLAAPSMLARGALDLAVLRLDDRPIAAAYLLQRADTYLYLTGFDPGVERLSLGTLLIGRAVERAFQRRDGYFDFLRGREPYKYTWMARDSTTQTRRIDALALAEREAELAVPA